MSGEAWAVVGVGASLAGLIAASHVVLWRAIHALDGRLTGAVEALAVDVRDVDRRLTAAVSDVDRRLARLEGWIEGERAGRSSKAREAPDAPATGA